MNRILFFLLSLLVSYQIQGQGQFKALLITKTAGWHHDCIVDAVPALEKLAKKHHFEMDRHQAYYPITSEQLEKYDLIIMANTTGNIFTTEEQAVFEAFIQSGKGFVGIHAASDTEYDWPWYRKLVGRMFHIHPAIQTGRLHVDNQKFPGMEQWPETLLWTDEWYEFGEDEIEGLNTLISIDESSYDPKADWGSKRGDGMGDKHPIAWYHYYDGGRSFYTAMGHLSSVYENHLFLEHLYGGIYWAATGKGIPK